MKRKRLLVYTTFREANQRALTGPATKSINAGDFVITQTCRGPIMSDLPILNKGGIVGARNYKCWEGQRFANILHCDPSEDNNLES